LTLKGATALVTGAAGFVGPHLARALAGCGARVHGLGNDPPRGELPLEGWHAADLRDPEALSSILTAVRPDFVVHLAGQTSAARSFERPIETFEVNALGTVRVLEAVRAQAPDAALVFASTNKVYGKLEEVDGPVDESRPLDFQSPYGCSKGAADQYVRDYARIYDLPTVVFRKSCIYGPRQFGVEDQGWVAWFTIAAVRGLPLTIYGDGKQVRDVLYIDDLVRAYLAAFRRIDAVAGEIFNIGGGPANTLSLLELLAMLRELTGRPVRAHHEGWRPGDQVIYVSDVRKAARRLGWAPSVSPAEGVRRLHAWVAEHPELFDRPRAKKRR